LRYDGPVNEATAMPRGLARPQPQLALVLIVLVALGWRLALWAQPLHGPANDEVEYIAVARDLLAGRGWSFYEGWRWLRAPLYPLFLAGSLWLAGGDLHLAALPNIALSVGLVYLIARLTSELAPDSGPGPVLIAASVAALLQTHATFASLYMSETLFSVLFTGALLALARWRRGGGRWALALAGALLGMACLTRSAALVFLPAVMLWLAWLELRRLGGPGPRALIPSLILALCAAATIAPWTLRNCRAYSACILIESGFSYNLWAFYEPHEDLATINITLEGIPDPAERAAVANERGLARLREDPTILLRKLPAEWERLWVVKPIQDRFLLPSAYSDPPPALFLSALLLDDLLYALVLGGGTVGLFALLARRNALATLLALWIAGFVAATLLTHAEGRYRHFLFMALIPCAALAIGELIRGSRPRPAILGAAAAPLALLFIPLLVYYPWQWAGSGAARSAYRWWGDAQAALAQPAAASSAYQAALWASETPDGWIALGDLRRSRGDVAGAEQAYELAHERLPTYVGASARLGDLLRAAGRDEEARNAFRGRYLDQASLLDWSFRFLSPRPVASIDLGDGLDYGYVAGVYPAEELQSARARWTDGRGLLRLATADSPSSLTLRVAAPHPDADTVPLQICAGAVCQEVMVGRAWREVRVLLPATAEPIELRSPTLWAPEGRALGVLVDWAAVAPAQLTTQTGTPDR
jgi:4-amino-4-deoxy-L-arabinose transferase-like glycosyltransferase